MAVALLIIGVLAAGCWAGRPRVREASLALDLQRARVLLGSLPRPAQPEQDAAQGVVRIHFHGDHAMLVSQLQRGLGRSKACG